MRDVIGRIGMMKDSEAKYRGRICTKLITVIVKPPPLDTSARRTPLKGHLCSVSN
jgi:hypothetical protein